MSAVLDPPTTLPAAELDRRFYAFAIDRAVAWSVDLVAAIVLWDLFVDEGSTVLGIASVALTVVLVGVLLSLLQGARGVTPGKAAMGLRLVGHDTGAPIGAGQALLRGLVLGVGALPTFGLGVATLAWTAVTDRDRLRRGWHDHLAGSVVVDVRPAPAEVAEEAPAPRRIVNLTAMRLVPAPAPSTVATPGRVDRPVGAPVAAVAGAAPPTPSTAASGPVPPAPEVVAGSPAETSGERPVLGAGSADRWRVGFDTGESFVVDGLVLVGRRPEPRPGEPVRHLVPLRSEDMSLSKTHAQLQVAADGVLVVTDRGSTNGSVLVRRGAPRELPAGTATTLLDGDVVRFGDRQMTVAREG